MERRALSAIFLTLIMLLSGCLGSDDSGQKIVETDTQEEILANLSLSMTNNNPSVGDIVVIEGLAVIEPKQSGYFFEVDLITPSGIRQIETTLSNTDDGFRLIFMPDEPGGWMAVARLIIGELDDSVKSQIEFNVAAPEEGSTVLSVDSIIEMDSSAPLSFSGKVFHSTPSSCSVSDGENTQSVYDDGEFTLGQGIVEESYNVTLTATCGIWTESQDSRTVRVILLSGNDMDGDGIPDDSDSCPNGYGEDDGWNPNPGTDRDGDGCHDFEEDLDDDNDLIPDVDDDCASEIGWVSTVENDYDRDGCADSTEDTDDDNDGISDEYDSCPKGDIGWESKPYTDWDGDGCRDLSEDLDDDNDLVNDTVDDCWRGLSNWVSNSEFDYDGDGCHDASEDEDDDNDGVNDVNQTGVVLDECPRTPLDAQDVDERGCDATERDTDGDGVMDSVDNCPGTPIGNVVNSVGCADLDGDGVFSNVDNCANTMTKWTPDAQGCAVYQLPVAWKETGHGNGRMDTVAHFSLPTLDGTWSFRNEWNGEDVYIFLFN